MLDCVESTTPVPRLENVEFLGVLLTLDHNFGVLFVRELHCCRFVVFLVPASCPSTIRDCGRFDEWFPESFCESMHLHCNMASPNNARFRINRMLARTAHFSWRSQHGTFSLAVSPFSIVCEHPVYHCHQHRSLSTSASLCAVAADLDARLSGRFVVGPASQSRQWPRVLLLTQVKHN